MMPVCGKTVRMKRLLALRAVDCLDRWRNVDHFVPSIDVDGDHCKAFAFREVCDKAGRHDLEWLFGDCVGNGCHTRGAIVNFVGLTGSAASYVETNEVGHAWPVEVACD
jgi:hypothetical protein